jgi:hypothetical protein
LAEDDGTPATTARVVPVGTTEGSGEDACRQALDATDPDDPEDQSERDACADWLRDHLTEAGGTAPAKIVQAAARAAGYSERTVKRARSRARIAFRNAGFPKTSVWYLPDLAGAGPAVGPQSGQSGQAPECGPTGPTGGPTGPEQCQKCRRELSSYLELCQGIVT